MKNQPEITWEEVKIHPQIAPIISQMQRVIAQGIATLKMRMEQGNPAVAFPIQETDQARELLIGLRKTIRTEFPHLTNTALIAKLVSASYEETWAPFVQQSDTLLAPPSDKRWVTRKAASQNLTLPQQRS